jgi:hypothetical protein
MDLYMLYFGHYQCLTREELVAANGVMWASRNEEYIKQQSAGTQRFINDVNTIAKNHGRFLLQSIVVIEQKKKWEALLNACDITKHVVYAHGPVKNRNMTTHPPRLFLTLFDIPKEGINACN